MKKRYHLFAFCKDKKDNPISYGSNLYRKTHPLQKYFAEKVGQPERIYLHAEIAALINSGQQKVHSIHISNIDYKTGRMGNAKPCPICLEAIKAYGVKKINYTTKDGWVYGKTPEEVEASYHK